MERKHKQYSDEFKLQVVKEYLEGNLGCRRLAQKYNLPSKNYILNWKDQLIKKGLLEDTHKKILKTLSNKNTKTAYEKQLERENLELKAQLAFYQEMKKLIEEDKNKKKKAILNLINKFPISLLCKIAEIDRSNFYKWLKILILMLMKALIIL